MATLRPSLRIQQQFRNPSPVVPDATNPAVLIGVHRQLEYRKSAGPFEGGVANGPFYFPNLLTSSAVETDSHEDAYLHPKVYVSGSFGVAEVTSDVTFYNMSNVSELPYFEISPTAEAVFVVQSGTTGSFESTSGGDAGVFIDANADFIEDSVSAGDVILVNGRVAFDVTSVTSDDELLVTRANSGPGDALVTLSTKSTGDARILTYVGDVYAGFLTSGVSQGDLVYLNGWDTRFISGGLTYTAADAEGIRTLTATGKFGSAKIGFVIMTKNADGEDCPSFVITELIDSNSVYAADLLGSPIPSTEAGGGAADLPARFFRLIDVTTTVPITAPGVSGYFTAADSVGLRSFTDADRDLYALGVTAGDWIMSSAANTGTLGSVDIVSAAKTVTRASGSFIDDGFEAGMKVVIMLDTTVGASSANLGEHEIDTVDDLVVTMTAAVGVNSAATAIVMVSRDSEVLFEVATTPSSATSTLSVQNVSSSGRAAAQFGGAIRYSVVTPAEVVAAVADSADVTAVSGVTGARYIHWPTVLPSAPLLGDYVFNDEGVLLFAVHSSAIIPPLATTNLAIVPGASTSVITRSIGVWTSSLIVGDEITIIGAADAGNNGPWVVTLVGSTALTVSGVMIANATDTAATVQVFRVGDHPDGGFDLADDDVITDIGLSVRLSDSVAHTVVRVIDETSIAVRHLVSGDEIDDIYVKGLDTRITLPNDVANLNYSVQKTLTGSALSGDVLVTYAGRRRDQLGEILEVSSSSVADLGPAVPGNPLAFAALNAVGNTGVVVKVVQVGDDTRTGWLAALDVLRTPAVYGIVPLTNDETILGDFRSHVLLESDPDNKRERYMWQCHQFDEVMTRWTGGSSDSATLVSTLTAQTVTITTSDGLMALGVVPGDYIEGSYTGYLAGQGVVSGTYRGRITAVNVAGSIYTFTMAPLAGFGVTPAAGLVLYPVVIESKPFSYTQLRDRIAAYPATIQSRRITNIYPDQVLVSFDDDTNEDDVSVGFYGGGTVTGYQIPNWWNAAAYAALRSGISVSYPLGKRPVSGTQRLVSPYLNDAAAQDVILDGGNMLLTQPGGDNSSIIALRGITTDVTSLTFLEEVVTAQIDNFARQLRRAIDPLLGAYRLDEAFFDVFSVTSSGVIRKVVQVDKDLRAAKLIEIREDPDRADTFAASYEIKAYFSNANGDIVIYHI